jgi:Raf kinase inhibitor-like YbhB/YbcL family protein
MSRRSRAVVLVVALLVMGGCLGAPKPVPNVSPSSSKTSPPEPFTIRSSAFEPTKPIPRENSCDATVGIPGNSGVSPPLTFRGVPPNATRLALIMEDPDAPSQPFVHWTFWNLDRNFTDLPKGADVKAHGAREGKAYGGPCPPTGTHRYFFYAYATDKPFDVPAGASVADLRAALRGHVAAQDSMYGTYSRLGVPPIAS